MLSKLQIFLLVLIVIGIGLLSTQKFWLPKLVNKIVSYDVPREEDAKTPVSSPITITSKKIEEENWSGTVPVITGTSPLAVAMREFIEGRISLFRDQANGDVPAIREKFGADNPSSTYTIDINTKYINAEKTESLATDIYMYTGGAHGSTMYKVLTASVNTGKILSLSDVIREDKQSAFVEFVKKQLNSWRPSGSDAPIVFPDEVSKLAFSFFSNWSLDDKNLVIYFDQYEIGPGVLGGTAFPLPFSLIRDFLNPEFSLLLQNQPARHFTDSNSTFTFNYDPFFDIQEGDNVPAQNWNINAKEKGVLLATVVIPKAYMPDTNFSEARFTVGRGTETDTINNCLVADATTGEIDNGPATVSGYPFRKLTAHDAAAGNYYETMSYRGIVDGDCYAIEYVIHSTNIGNYSPDQGIKEFDKSNIENKLSEIVKSFKFLINSD